MDNVVIDTSMSLDGYVAAPNDNPEPGRGEAGMRLHNWMFDDRSVFERVYGFLVEETGAVIIGRRTYDYSIPEWSGKGPLGDVPVLRGHPQGDRWRGPDVHIRHRRDRRRSRKAQEVAGGKRIGLMGANLDQQFLAAGPVDAIRIHGQRSCSVEDDPYSIGFRSGSS
jgi:dihydrofolate reductase